jgi:hypothetical protein
VLQVLHDLGVVECLGDHDARAGGIDRVLSWERCGD